MTWWGAVLVSCRHRRSMTLTTCCSLRRGRTTTSTLSRRALPRTVVAEDVRVRYRSSIWFGRCSTEARRAWMARPALCGRDGNAAVTAARCSIASASLRATDRAKLVMEVMLGSARQGGERMTGTITPYLAEEMTVGEVVTGSESCHGTLHYELLPRDCKHEQCSARQLPVSRCVSKKREYQYI